MQLTSYDTARRGGAKAHRPGGIDFVYLLEGQPMALDNYMLAIVQAQDYHAPRHRHHFEQIRILLEGHFGFDAGLSQEPGSVGYFCEGTYYTQDARGLSRTLLLQVAGPSGQSYMSERQMNEGIAALSSRGVFKDGVFTWHDAQGKKHNQDGYEAIAEQVFGRPVAYPKPAYETPVILRPERFAYLPLDGAPGVALKHLGTFNERRLSLQMLRLDAGAPHIMSDPAQSWLVCCVSGTGQVNGQTYAPWSAWELRRREQAQLLAHTASEFYLFGLPVFGEGSSEAFEAKIRPLRASNID